MVGLTMLAVALLVLHPTVVQAQYAYTTNNGAITITGYDCGSSGSAVSIPGSLNGLPVTMIGGSAFQGCRTLTNLTIPASVTNIGDFAFADCFNLTAITVDPANPFFSSVAGALLSKNQTTFIQLPAAWIGSYTIPAGVTVIGPGAFGGCTNLTGISIPSSVVSIGGFAFNSCSSLTNIVIPGGVTTIGGYAFRYCYGLASLAIPSSVTTLGVDLVEACTNLTAITVDSQNPAYSTADGVLFNKSQTTLLRFPAGKPGSYVIPPTVTSVMGEAFRFATKLVSVTIPNSVTSIGGFAFEQCTSLVNVTVGTGVSNIGDLAFGSCRGLMGIFFAGNAPSLGGANVFNGDNGATVYYFAGTTGWGPTYGDLPTAPSAMVNGLANPAGEGVVTGGGVYPTGSNSQLVATAYPCWVFTSWSDGSLQNPRTISVPATNVTYTATFTQISYPVGTTSSPALGGTTSGGGTLFCGSNVTVHVTNTAPFQFIGWTETGLVVSTNANYSFTVTSNRNLVAQFDRAPTVAGLLAVTNSMLVISNRYIVVAGETNVFRVGATDPDGNALTYRWIYGDGATSAGSAVSSAAHVYAATNCGPYTASVTVSDGHLTSTSNLAVFAACELTITKLQVSLNFAKPTADAIALTGKFQLPGITNLTQLAGGPVVVGVGGVQVPFTLDSKGRGISTLGTARLAYTKPTRTRSSYWTATISLSKGNWQASLATAGLTNETIAKPARVVTLAAGLLLTNEVFAAETTLHYTAKQNKTGTAK